MASDEAIQLSLDYLNSKRVHDKLVNALNDNNISEILDLVQDGYIQGRADAWRWIPVSEKRPEFGDRMLALYQDGSISVVRCVEGRCDEYGMCEVVCQDECGDSADDEFTHWLPITLPTEAK